jgi:CTP synthase
VNNHYREQIAQSGLVFSGTSPDGHLVEYVELPKSVHPYYIGTQAHPEFRSRPTKPNPMFHGLVKAALERQKQQKLFDES